MFNKYWFVGWLLIAAIPAAALDNDSGQPIDIEADKVTLDETGGIARYEGRVVLRQGSIQISAEELVLFSHNGQLQHIEVNGNPDHPAIFRQQTESGQETRAEAEHMKFNLAESHLVLTGRASMNLGASFIRSKRIEYNTRTGKLAAGAHSNPSPTERVHIVITPDTNNQTKPNRK